MDYKWKGTAELIVGIIVGSVITWGIMEYKCIVKQRSTNLKCIQGELYEEIKPNIHQTILACFNLKESESNIILKLVGNSVFTRGEFVSVSLHLPSGNKVKL